MFDTNFLMSSYRKATDRESVHIACMDHLLSLVSSLMRSNYQVKNFDYFHVW